MNQMQRGEPNLNSRSHDHGPSSHSHTHWYRGNELEPSNMIDFYLG
jgi:hypothetical protein